MFFQIQHHRLDLRQINAAIQVVFRERIGFQKNGIGTGQHHRIGNRLVAIG